MVVYLKRIGSFYIESAKLVWNAIKHVTLFLTGKLDMNFEPDRSEEEQEAEEMALRQPITYEDALRVVRSKRKHMNDL